MFFIISNVETVVLLHIFVVNFFKLEIFSKSINPFPVMLKPFYASSLNEGITETILLTPNKSVIIQK